MLTPESEHPPNIAFTFNMTYTHHLVNSFDPYLELACVVKIQSHTHVLMSSKKLNKFHPTPWEGRFRLCNFIKWKASNIISMYQDFKIKPTSAERAINEIK